MSNDPFDSFSFLSQGAIIQSFNVAGHNIVQGFANPDNYRTHNTPFFGENIGRVANRISNARINNLNGKSYDLEANNGPNALHGGSNGWGKHTFTGPTKCMRDGLEAVLYTYLSRNNEEGYPGTVEVRIWYIPQFGTDETGVVKTSLTLEYEAELISDSGEDVQETVINMTNHSYFNITGTPSVAGTHVTLSTNAHQTVDETSIPTGKIAAFPGLEANQEFVLGEIEPDIDHCFIVEDDPSKVPIDTRKQPLRKLVSMAHPGTKLHFEAWSTEPAFQFYTGKYIDVPAIDGSPARKARSGLCIEASRYVNAINDDRWRDMVVLKKGEIYGSKTVYKCWKAE